MNAEFQRKPSNLCFSVNGECDSVEGYRRERGLYRVIRNDCRGFNNLSYTIHL